MTPVPPPPPSGALPRGGTPASEGPAGSRPDAEATRPFPPRDADAPEVLELSSSQLVEISRGVASGQHSDPTQPDPGGPAALHADQTAGLATVALPTASPATPRRRHRLWLALLSAPALGACLLTAGAALYLRTQAEVVPAAVRLYDAPISDGPDLTFATLPAALHRRAEAILDQRVTLRAGDERVRATLRELGVTIDEPATLAEARALLQSGDALRDLRVRLALRQGGPASLFSLTPVVGLSRQRALDFLSDLKERTDRAASDARLDLERHTIAPERQGSLLRVYDSLIAIEYAARALGAGRTPATLGELPLAVARTEPSVRQGDLKDVDVSTVLATWETRYSSAAIDNDRTYNLKVGADKLNGHIIKPGEVFSFNGVVGNRTEREGYRVAPVIQGGELVDGLAGGMCQIASTLHAAAFFAGLDIVRSTPHSRPSVYIPMGLDSTVVWPSVDLKLKNPFPFPVVLHYMVNQGSVKVEILGKERPYKVAYEREILSETGFGVQTRPDPSAPLGQRLVDQEGYPGYRIKRRRYLYTGEWKRGKTPEDRPQPEGLVSVKEWDIAYPATTQIVRVGAGPSSLKKKDPPPSHRIPPIPAQDKPLFYIIK